jgi:hypothetical protein
MELAGNEIDGETVRSGDDDPIPSQFVAESFSQLPGAAGAPRNLHGVAARGIGGGRQSWRQPTRSITNDARRIELRQQLGRNGIHIRFVFVKYITDHAWWHSYIMMHTNYYKHMTDPYEHVAIE